MSLIRRTEFDNLHTVTALDGPWIDCRWCHWIFQWHICYWPYHGHGVESASSENEYQEHFWK